MAWKLSILGVWWVVAPNSFDSKAISAQLNGGWCQAWQKISIPYMIYLDPHELYRNGSTLDSYHRMISPSRAANTDFGMGGTAPPIGGGQGSDRGDWRVIRDKNYRTKKISINLCL